MQGFLLKMVYILCVSEESLSAFQGSYKSVSEDDSSVNRADEYAITRREFSANWFADSNFLMLSNQKVPRLNFETP